jgi:periplasmic protein TonB
MTYAQRLGICAVASMASHLLLARGTAHLPARVEAAQPVILSVNLRQTAPKPEPEPVKPQGEEPSKQPLHEAPARRARVADAAKQATPTKNITPTERPAATDSNSDTPVFGISMESTSTAGTGPSIRVGNTLQTKRREHMGEAEPGGARPLAAPVPAYQVTKMPLPKGGTCPPGPYTNEAREAGLEGIVILSFVVDESGRVRDIKVLQGLGIGLTEAAKSAVQACAFSPGERDGKPVPTRVSSFKIRFNLREDE